MSADALPAVNWQKAGDKENCIESFQALLAHIMAVWTKSPL
ncbi:MAG: hypothetical protein ACYC4S_09875 [Rhodoferax sp.]